MRYLYTFIYCILIPLLFLRLLWRSVRQPDYRKHWSERLALRRTPQVQIWIHAVSVGEAHLALHLIQHWWPDDAVMPAILISCTTPTGRNRIESWIQQHPQAQVSCTYLPFDIPILINKVLRQSRLQQLIVMETEIWPTLLHAAKKQQIRSVLVNARMSAHSARGYTKIGQLSRPAFSGFDLVLAQTSADARRLQVLGVRHNVCHVTGSMKFDFSVTRDIQALQGLQQEYNKRVPIWTIGSSRMGEEQVLAQAIKHLVQHYPEALICWAPRHKERSNPVIEKLLQQAGINFVYASDKRFDNNTQVLLIDTFGELSLYYALANFVYIGGTLVPTGSQNLIEPALLGKPVISGPSCYNFAQAHQVLQQSGGLLRVDGAESLNQTLLRLTGNKQLAVKLGQQGCEAIQCHQGATWRNITLLQQQLDTI